MIELLNKCRIAREGSESASRELGYAFGEAFESAYGDVGEVQVSALDTFTRPEHFTIDNLRSQILGGRTLFAQAFGDVNCEVIRRNPSTEEWSVGIRFPNDSRVNMEGSEVILHEASFVRGFIDGFNASRKRRTPQRNGSPALAR